MANRLADETSPYLRQHADNPVDWHPWGPKALEAARASDRPILLSVGYSSCHWCHVMERESFEDARVAALMNERFVNVKVDREERPDVDQVYMKAVQAMTGGGGWPMTVFLTPELVPYFGGTYFPPEPRHGLPSFSQVLVGAAQAYHERREAVVEAGAQLVEAIGRTATSGGGGRAGVEALDQTYRALADRYDPTHGGFGSAPKFPQPPTLELLVRHHARTGDPHALEMAVHTLRRMAAGGMRDHLGGGFHRYSVDARWLVPHFEKMLYDNALLARCYVDAYRLTGSDDLREVAESTLDWLLEDMRSAEGAFYSARDADSEGEEGTFYVWTPEQVRDVLPAEDAALFERLYDVTGSGNFEGRSIPHLPHDPVAVASAEGIGVGELERRMSASRRLLREARSRREPPFRDEKILASWNGLTIRALAEAGATLGVRRYVTAAEEAGDFLWSVLRPDGRLLHLYVEGEARVGAFLDDHGALGNAFLSLHEATLEPRWLERAVWLCDEIVTRFADGGTVFDTANDAEPLFIRPRDPMDNATPSGPSLAAELLARLGHLTGDEHRLATARQIVDGESDALLRYGPAFGRMLSVLDRMLADPVEVAVVGRRGDAATEALVAGAHERFERSLVITGSLGEDAPSLALLEGRDLVDGRAAAYVCRRFACRRPVTEPAALLAELGSAASGGANR